MTEIAIRPLDPVADIDWCFELNETCVPEVNSLPKDELARLIGDAAHARAAWLGDRPAGVMIAFGPGVDYGSLNYAWFGARHEDFVYMDRIMVHERARRLGVGRLLYHDLFEAAAGRFPFVACEVNSRPPNPGSMRFHEQLGFRPVGEQETEGGAKAVVLLRRDL
ncbi:MAG: GNAT family N-acetyltransferase [Alphaproteobacteria bacterium]|nr:GNAT family N-acetyltransferase [Alphaproteobacteria bacterium]